MSDPILQPAPAAPAPGLSQWQRVAGIFSSPSKVFQDIAAGHRSWWLPFLLVVLVSYGFFATITVKIGWDQVAQNAIHFNPKAEARLADAPPAQRAASLKFTRWAMEGSFAASPIFILAIGALTALVLWGTINFGFGGKSNYGGIFAVWMYASLPSLIKSLLGMIVIFAGMAPESFNLKNFAPTNIGAFLSPTDTNAALYSLATSMDFVTIWTLVLLGIGIAAVARVKRGSGYMAVFGWWAIIVLVSVGIAAVTG
ncbi:MAG TPA: YIP1 family protein [Terracidiphilus sp.]|nr:YIP1 family protein [Terracidiphilus sp.]